MVSGQLSLGELFEFVLESVELSKEVLEESRLLVFLQSMVEEAYAKHELFSILVFADYVCGFGALNQRCQIVMSAEVEVHHFGHFSVFSFYYVEVIGFLYVIHS